MNYQITALIEREGDGYVSRCPELDVTSQGDSIEEARANLQEAVELFLECASPEEIEDRLLGTAGDEPPRRGDEILPAEN